MVALLVSKVIALSPWILGVGSSLYVFLTTNEEPEPSMFAYMGMLFMVILTVGAVWFSVKQLRRYYQIKKSTEEV